MKQPWLAVFLSLLLPGTGQIYAGKKDKGIIVMCLWIGVYLGALACMTGFLFFSTGNTSRQLLMSTAILWISTLLIQLYALFAAYKAAKDCNLKPDMTIAVALKKPWFAVFLSRIWPGLGQLYNRQILKGIAFIVATFVLFGITEIHYSLYVLLLPLSFFTLKDAFESANKINGSQGVFLKEESRILKIFVLAMILLGVIPVGDIVKSHVVKAYKIPAGSMVPTLEIGDRILIDKTKWGKLSIKRGDIVVFKYPEDPRKDFIKRIVAIGGDTIEIKDKVVFINGSPLSEPYIRHTDPLIKREATDPRDNIGPYTVPQNKFFAMGDNRDQSYDSRYWGYVPDEYIIGKALKIYWSWDAKNAKVRWDRIGKAIQQY